MMDKNDKKIKDNKFVTNYNNENCNKYDYLLLNRIFFCPVDYGCRLWKQKYIIIHSESKITKMVEQ